MNKKLRRSRRFIYYSLAFIIPTMISSIVFYMRNLAPFGNNSLLCMDLWGQYFPMYVQHATAQSLSDYFYSWNGALGYNVLAQNGYYCNSLFLILFRFCKPAHWITLLNIICLLKISFSSVAFFAFLEYKTKKTSIYYISGSVAYSLCAYALAYISQPMWTDALIYTPLILLGLERLIRHKKFLFYTIMLALCIYSNFYIGFEVCIFVALYFLGNYCAHFSDYWKTFVRFSIASILAAALTAIVLIPTVLALQKTAGVENASITTITLYDSFLTYFKLLLPQQALNYGYDGANISSGLFCILFLPFYFLNQKFQLTERIRNGLILCFMVLSLNLNILDYIWHGFHFPNQLPARWSFLLSLFIVYLSCIGISRLRTLSTERTIIGTIIGLLFILVIDHLGNGNSLSIRYFVLLAISVLLLIAPKYFCQESNLKSTYKKLIPIVSILLVSLWILDVGNNFIQVAMYDDGDGLHYSEGTSYTEKVIKNMKWGSEQSHGSNDFYRVETNARFTFNPSMFGSSDGISYYSSTFQGSVYKMLQSLGYPVYGNNVSTIYNISSPVLNSIFGIKYYLDYSHNLENDLYGATRISEDSECDVWENTEFLPLAFAVSENIQNWEVTDEIRAIQNQDTLLDLMCGYDANIFQKMSTESFNYTNATLEENSNWNQNYFHRIDGEQPVTIHYTYRCVKDAPVFLEHNYRVGDIKVTSSGSTTKIDISQDKFCYLGEYQTDDIIEIDVTIDNIDLGCIGLNLYVFDYAQWLSAYNKFNNSALELSTFSTTSFAGTIDVKESGIIFTSIPQDGGWKVTCDNQQADTVLLGDSLIGIKLDAGKHYLTFKYSVPGLKTGFFVSLLALGIALIWKLFQL